MSTRSQSIPLSVKRALRKLGADIRVARKRRRLPTRLVAERALISPTTLVKIERGDPSTTIGRYATVLMVLGMTERLADLADAAHDELGLAIAEEDLPQRVRLPRTAASGARKREGS